MHVKLNRRQLLKRALAASVGLAVPVKVSARPVMTREPSAPKGAAALSNRDALHTRVRAELKMFTDWLAAEKVKGFIGEAGWPDDSHGRHESCRPPRTCRNDEQRWNDLADVWFYDADAAGLWVAAWATGQWWKTKYSLAAYEATRDDRPVSRPNTQSKIIEKHLSAAGYQRGISVCGGEFGAPADTDPFADNFSNANPGLYGKAYHFDSPQTFKFLAERGLTLVRIPFRWERLQPSLDGPLDAAELKRLRDVVTSARDARGPRAPDGLTVILDMHNYGAYYRGVPGKPARGERLDMGLGEVSKEQFADVWRRISVEFKADPGVVYGLMCEPVDKASTEEEGCATRGRPVELWEQASQAALEAIRGNGDEKLVIVSGYCWSKVVRWTALHPKKWIVDASDNHLYEAHHYWDRDGSGSYCYCYADEVEDAESRGYKP